MESYQQRLNGNSVLPPLQYSREMGAPTRLALLLPAMSLRDCPSLHHPVAGRLLIEEKKKVILDRYPPLFF